MKVEWIGKAANDKKDKFLFPFSGSKSRWENSLGHFMSYQEIIKFEKALVKYKEFLDKDEYFIYIPSIDERLQRYQAIHRSRYGISRYNPSPSSFKVYKRFPEGHYNINMKALTFLCMIILADKIFLNIGIIGNALAILGIGDQVVAWLSLREGEGCLIEDSKLFGGRNIDESFYSEEIHACRHPKEECKFRVEGICKMPKDHAISRLEKLVKEKVFSKKGDTYHYIRLVDIVTEIPGIKKKNS